MTNNRRSPCPVACTLDLIGDKWTLLIIRDLMRGCRQFKEFLRSPEGISTNILADRLNRLVEHGLAERHIPKGSPGRVVYRLTRKGKSLRPVLKAMMLWGLKHIADTEARLAPK